MNSLVKLSRFISRMSLIGGYVSVATCAGMVVLCLIEIFSRALFNIPIAISVEILPWLLVCLVFMGISWTLSVGGHIQITIVIERLPLTLQKWLEICRSIVGIVCLAFFCIWVWDGLLHNYMENAIGFQFPLWWAWVPMLIGAVIFFIQLLASLLNSIISFNESGGALEQSQRGEK